MPKDRPLRRFIVVSGALHLVCCGLAGILPVFSREAQWTPAPLIVSLVPLAEPEAAPKPAAAAPTRRTRPAESQPPAVEKPRPEAPKLRQTKPARTEPRRNAEPKPQPEAVKPTGVESAAADTLKAQPSVANNLRMAARIDEAAFTFDYYLPQIVSRISSAWQQPAGISGQGEGPAATIRFRIRRNGTVTEVAVEDPSRVPFFDQSAQQAIASVQPLPPLPPSYGGEWLTVHLRFIYSDAAAAGWGGR